MHDIRFIRDDGDAFDQALRRRNLPPQSASILKLDETRREMMTALQDLQQKRNEASRKIGDIKREGGDSKTIMDEVAAIKDDIADLEDRVRQVGEEIEAILLSLPNMIDSDIPEGKDESDNVLIRSHGTADRLPFAAKDHVELGEALGLMDFAAGVKISGARFVVLRGGLARLERALASFMLDIHTNEFGYQEVLPPALVKTETMQGTGQLPKFADDLFRTDDDRWLIPTAEVPLTNLVADDILTAETLPLRMTAYTPCFRAEAGSAGRDTRGMIRQHQFSKVELVSIVAPEDSSAELDRMTACAEEILKRLGLSYRVMLLSSGDTGFSAQRTYDIEVWLPGQDDGQDDAQNNGQNNDQDDGKGGGYREISSCSNCGDFQARRMKARFRNKGEKDTRFVHTLNGSGLAIGRTMIAILENYQQDDGSIRIPDALLPYMGGITTIDNGEG
jgi:seryl-tRNA synthetase